MNIFDISIFHEIFDIVDIKQLFSFLTWHSNLTQGLVFYLTALIRDLHPQEIKARQTFALRLETTGNACTTEHHVLVRPLIWWPLIMGMRTQEWASFQSKTDKTDV